MSKSIISFLATCLFLIYTNIAEVKAYTVSMTTKESLNFEILNIEITNEALNISGWAFINENQHYKNAFDHAIQVEFISLSGSRIVDATLTNLSMTSSYEQLGLSYCADGVYYSTTCNYYYEYVGFSATIPLSLFEKGQKYTTNILFSAYNSKTYLKTPLYYPIVDPIQTKIGDYQYSIISALNDTQIKVIETPIYARKAPGKTGTIWATGTICSMNYSNKLYFKYNSVYRNILSRFTSDNQTYYEVKAQLDVCQDMRRRIIEGTALTPVWISGMFVEYSGSPLEINSVLVNSKPVIFAENISINAGENINLLDYAKCYDLEDGDISSKIIIESTDFINRGGIYSVTYYVEDKYGYSDRKTIAITVNEKNNDPPFIYANDKVVELYSEFDYLKDVKASDLQDGNITSQLVVMNHIDTSILGDQSLCYKVTDTNNLTTVKCVIITVYDYKTEISRFRYVSKNNLFYMEIIPAVWTTKIAFLKNILESSNSLISIKIDP